MLAACCLAGCVSVKTTRFVSKPVTQENIDSVATSDAPATYLPWIKFCLVSQAQVSLMDAKIHEDTVEGVEGRNCAGLKGDDASECKAEQNMRRIPLAEIDSMLYPEPARQWVMLADPMPMPIGGC